MAGNAAPFNQNFTSDKKSTDVVEKDIRKWVESVVEFKANMDKQKGSLPLEKHLKKIKKFKMKRKPSVLTLPVMASKDHTGHNKSEKYKKGMRKPIPQAPPEKPPKKELETVDVFDTIKESYRTLKLPQNWTSGVSGNRVIFNRIKLTTQNAQQKVAVEKSIVITKDCNVHILIKGSEVIVNNWETQKVNTLDDIKKAIKDIDSLKLCEGPSNGAKSAQCSTVIDKKQKVCEACKSETTNSPKKIKKTKAIKKTGVIKGVTKKKSFQN